MTRRIRVTAIYHKEPVIRLYVLALIELARQLQEEEVPTSTGQLPDPKSGESEDQTND